MGKQDQEFVSEEFIIEKFGEKEQDRLRRQDNNLTGLGNQTSYKKFFMRFPCPYVCCYEDL
jgi:hypothetical protein